MDVPRVTGAAQRRKQRRIRLWWRHEQVSVAAAVATALHHSAQRGGGVVRRHFGNRRQWQQGGGGAPWDVRSFNEDRIDLLPGSGRRAAGGDRAAHGVGYELVLNPVVPQMAEQLVEVSLPVEYISLARAVFQASSPVVEHYAPASAVIPAPAPVVECFAPALSVVLAPTQVGGSILHATVPAMPQARTQVVETTCTRASSVPSFLACGGVSLAPRLRLYKRQRLWRSILHLRLRLSMRQPQW